MNFLRVTILLAMAYWVTGCAANAEPPMYFQDNTALGVVDFATVNTIVFKQSCTSCHSTKLPHLDTYAEVKASLSAIEDDVFVKHSMPKGKSLSGQQLALLRKWIDLGAPNEATDPGPGNPAPAPTPATWKAMTEKFVNVSCAGCHYKDNPEGRTDLTDVTTFKASIGSIMYLALVEKEAPMPPLDKPKLTDEQKRVLTEWVIANQPEE